MKVAIFGLCLFLVSTDALNCIQGKDGSVAATDCAGVPAATVCSGPMFIEYYTGVAAGIDYKCGPCADTKTKDKTCMECDKDGCNKIPEAGTPFTCVKYKYGTDKWVRDATNTTCTPKKGNKEIVCNMPKTEEVAKDKYAMTLAAGGCGLCSVAETKDGSCADCSKKECNVWASGAARISALVLPLLTALYMLL